MLGISLWFLLSHVFGRDRYARELHRRSGWVGRRELAAAARRDVAGDAGPEWSLVFSGRGLPNGSRFHARLDGPGASTPGGRLVFASLVDRRFDAGNMGDPREDLAAGTVAVTAADLAPFQRALADTETSPLDGTPAAPVRDGYRFRLQVFRRGQRAPLDVEGNLAGGCVDTRTLILVQGILDLAHAHGAPKSLYGSCDERGNVVIGEM